MAEKDIEIEDNRFVERKKESIFLLSLLAFTGVAFYAFLNVFLADYQAAITEFIVCALLLYGIWDLRTNERIEVVSDIMMLAGTILFCQNFYSGGFAGTGLYWILVAPLLYFLFSNSRSGIRWTLYLQLALFTLYISGSIFEFIDISYEPFSILMLFVVLNVSALLTYSYQKNIEGFQSEILENEKLIKDKDTQRREFIKIVSDRIRTPMNTARWNMELLQEGNYKIAKEPMRFIEESYAVVINAIERVDLLTLAVDENISKVTLQTSEFDLKELLNKIIKSDFIASTLKKRNVTIKTKFAKKKATVLADEAKIELSLRTIIHNAVVYSKESGGEVEVELEINNAKKTYEVRVSDSGIGIKKEDLQRIFEPFYRGSNASSVSTNNNGVGLYIAKVYIEKNKGSIAVDSVLNQGTTVSITLPFPKIISKLTTQL